MDIGSNQISKITNRLIRIIRNGLRGFKLSEQPKRKSRKLGIFRRQIIVLSLGFDDMIIDIISDGVIVVGERHFEFIERRAVHII